MICTMQYRLVEYNELGLPDSQVSKGWIRFLVMLSYSKSKYLANASGKANIHRHHHAQVSNTGLLSHERSRC